MAKEDLQRYAVKYVRDRAKAKYDKGIECFICGSLDDLDFHHFYSLADLWNKWTKKNNITISCVDDIKLHRETFIEEHLAELYEHTVTLCHTHHLKLHSIYGKSPKSLTAGKQQRWCQRIREKHGLV